MDIRRADLTEEDVIALLELHACEMDAGSPPGTSHVLDLSGLKAPEIEVITNDRFLGYKDETHCTESCRSAPPIPLPACFARVRAA